MSSQDFIKKPIPVLNSEVFEERSTISHLPSALVSTAKTDIFLTITSADIPNGTLEYLHKQNNLLKSAHDEIEQLEEWVIVLLILSDLTQEKEESYKFAQTAYSQSKQLSSAQFIHGSICRLAIKEFEKQESIGEKSTSVEILVNQALEVSSTSKDMVASLCSCASALYWIYMRTGQYGDLAEDYCLKASLFNPQYEDYLVEIQEKLNNLSDFDVFQQIAWKNVMFGLKDKIVVKYCKMLQKRLRQKNKPNSGNDEEVKSLLEEWELWQNKNTNVSMKVETFIHENQKWSDRSLNNLILSSDANLYVISRLLEEYSIIGNHLSPESQFHLNYLFVKQSLALSGSLVDFEDDNIINLAYAFHYLASHYGGRRDTFMAMVILLELKKLALNLLESHMFMLKNNPVVRANWYFFCIRALERVIEMYPNHVLSTQWKSEIEQLGITKGAIDSFLVFNDWEREENIETCCESIIVVDSTDENADWGV